MSNATIAKATIIRLDKLGNEQTDDRIECMFNPTEYKISKSNFWPAGKPKGANIPKVDFGSGGAATLEMQLFFDTYGSAKNGIAEDVRTAYTDKILNLMMIPKDLKDTTTDKGRPPYVRFLWGTTWSFTAVITQINQQFTMFLGDGTPVRATLDVVFQQIDEDMQRQQDRQYPATNPTSGGTGGERVWTVREGDTLALIAYQEYGDAKRWRLIAAHNRLSQVRQLRPGTVLEIPNA
jgi:nucleoid-associated protein YgaU